VKARKAEDQELLNKDTRSIMIIKGKYIKKKKKKDHHIHQGVGVGVGAPGI
jgi:hypothetical protein